MNTKNLSRVLTLAAICTAVSWAATGTSFADDHHDAWSHDKTGYWDTRGEHHAFVTRESHHGYWREKDDGTRIFINID